MLPDSRTPFEDVWPNREDLAQKFIIPPDSCFDAAHFKQELNQRIATAAGSGKVPTISHERLSGNPNSGAFDMEQTARRIHEAAPNARILIVLREQESATASIWSQAIRIGLYCSIKDYLREYHSGDFRSPYFKPHYLCYDRIVNTYAELFGRDQILVMDFAKLQRSPTEYLNEICGFNGVNAVSEVSEDAEYARPNAIETKLLRRGNLLFRRTTLNSGPPFESARMFLYWRKLSHFVARMAPRWAIARANKKIQDTAAEYIDRHDATIRKSNQALLHEFGVELIDPKWRT